MSTHHYPIRVRWGDCDPAGIAYTAHFFDWFHQAMESWFDTVLKHPYADLILKQRVGFPNVHTEADFQLPCRLGEDLVLDLRLGKLGTSSFRLDFEVRSGSLVKATGTSTCVVVRLGEEISKMPIPTDLRDRMAAFMRDS